MVYLLKGMPTVSPLPNCRSAFFFPKETTHFLAKKHILLLHIINIFGSLHTNIHSANLINLINQINIIQDLQKFNHI